MEMIKRKGESYQHAAARTVFKNWLDRAGHGFGPMQYWYGEVWEEYPLIAGYDNQLLSEIAPDIPMANPPIPTYEELAIAGLKPWAIADIACGHKGSIVHIVEIVHKHDISDWKIDEIRRRMTSMSVDIWRVEAHWVLSQIDVPTNFPEQCFRRMNKPIYYPESKCTVKFFD